MHDSITITRSSLLYDISNLAFVVGDVASDFHTPHSLHQIFDICAPGNIDRVNRLLDLAFAETCTILRKIISGSAHCRDYQLILKYGKVSCEWKRRLQETIREFMTAKVLAGWLSITLPEAADVWNEKANEMKTALSSATFSTTVRTRRVPPI